MIRGGAIGDFILTLPAIKLIRDELPEAEVHLLGYRHIAAVAENRFYARSVTSIEYGPLAPFFARGGELPEALAGYFAGFQQIISYLYDPDEIFLGNLQRCGARDVIVGDPLIGDHAHAAEQLAAPLARLALFLEDPSAKVFPSAEDFSGARNAWGASEPPALLIHPGSGSPAKNWPAANWAALLRLWLGANPGSFCGVISGESDGGPVKFLREEFESEPRVRFLPVLRLPVLAALLAWTGKFAGHDSGISHLAAAAGARCALIFGPTDPEVWAPLGPHVRVLASPEKIPALLEPAAMHRAMEEHFS